MNYGRVAKSAGVGCVLLSAIGASPRSAEISRSWELDFKFRDPQRIAVLLSGDVKETVFWYVVYQVTNNTGRDVDFYPSFRLVTDTLKVVDGGEQIHPRVYDLIAAQHKIEFPFFAQPTKITGTLLQGDENARASAAVFRDMDSAASGFTMYASGLSGQVDRIRNPSFDASAAESPENPRAFLLRRTLAVRYDLPGDSTTSSFAAPVRRSRDWVMQ